MTTISLSDVELATTIAALRVVAADAQTHGAAVVQQECEALATRLQATVVECKHEFRFSVTLGFYCPRCKQVFNEARCAFCGAVVINGHCTDPVGHAIKEAAQGED